MKAIFAYHRTYSELPIDFTVPENAELHKTYDLRFTLEVDDFLNVFGERVVPLDDVSFDVSDCKTLTLSNGTIWIMHKITPLFDVLNNCIVGVISATLDVKFDQNEALRMLEAYDKDPDRYHELINRPALERLAGVGVKPKLLGKKRKPLKLGVK